MRRIKQQNNEPKQMTIWENNDILEGKKKGLKII